MALVDLYNKQGIIVTPLSVFPIGPLATTTATVNAAGESLAFVGPIYLSSGPSTSKVISSAGGKIWFHVGGINWSSAGTTVRVGIQDVDVTTGLEDGVYDVYDDLVQGTDALAVGVKEVTMSSGTKTIANGDTVALVIEMTVRNGTDSLSPTRFNITTINPYVTADTGAGPVKGTTGSPYCVIQFDDGTIGHFGDWTIIATDSGVSFGSGSTPDEYAMVFEVPFTCAINTIYAKIAELDAGETGNIHLIEDPFGTDTNLQTVTLDPDIAATTSTPDSYLGFVIPETTLTINTQYAISYRPTSAGLRSARLLTFADSAHLAGLGIEFSGASRTNVGAWGSSSTVILDAGFRISKLDDGTGGGAGGATSAAYLG